MAVFLVSGLRTRRLRNRVSEMQRSFGKPSRITYIPDYWKIGMLEPLEVYVLVQRDGRWWLPYGPEADTNALSHVFSSDCSVVFSDLMVAVSPMT